MTPLSPEYLREALDYDGVTGLLAWKPRPRGHFPTDQAHARWNTMFAGAPAFHSLDSHGYYAGKIAGRKHLAHRVIFAIVHNRWPSMDIDHRDGVPTNNRIDNLREATVSQNRQNEANRNKRIGLKGVAASNPTYPNTRYNARIQLNGKYIYLGSFDTPEQAHAAYKEAAEKHFGEFARAA